MQIKESSITKQYHKVVPPSSTTNEAYVASEANVANAAKEEAAVRNVAGLAAKKGAADEAVGSNSKTIEEAAVEKGKGSLACLATVKDAADKAASSHAKDRVSDDASENVAAKVATEKLAEREHVF